MTMATRLHSYNCISYLDFKRRPNVNFHVTGFWWCCSTLFRNVGCGVLYEEIHTYTHCMQLQLLKTCVIKHNRVCPCTKATCTMSQLRDYIREWLDPFHRQSQVGSFIEVAPMFVQWSDWELSEWPAERKQQNWYTYVLSLETLYSIL